MIISLQRSLNKHKKTHSAECDVCHQVFGSDEFLRKHKQRTKKCRSSSFSSSPATSNSSRKEHSCLECGASFTRKQKLNAHQKFKCNTTNDSDTSGWFSITSRKYLLYDLIWAETNSIIWFCIRIPIFYTDLDYDKLNEKHLFLTWLWAGLRNRIRIHVGSVPFCWIRIRFERYGSGSGGGVGPISSCHLENIKYFRISSWCVIRCYKKMAKFYDLSLQK